MGIDRDGGPLWTMAWKGDVSSTSGDSLWPVVMGVKDEVGGRSRSGDRSLSQMLGPWVPSFEIYILFAGRPNIPVCAEWGWV